MKIVNVDEVEWFEAIGHRGGGIRFRRLLQGEDKSANNFEFNIADVQSKYTTPRHRHNFDQVRFMLSGSFGFDNGQVQEEGTVGYFPEGCYYEQQAEGASSTLLLQTSGASRAPYLSFNTVQKLVGELAETGKFKDGIYTTQRNGKKVNKDGFEAVWEYATGQDLKYPKPRFNRPIIMNPRNFSYVDVDGEPGVARKMLGRFGERELEIGFLRMAAGSEHHFAGRRDGDCLLYVLSGGGKLGDREWSAGTAMHLSAGDEAALRAGADSEIYYLRLPTRVS